MNIHYITLVISAVTFFSLASVGAHGQLIGMGEKAKSESSKSHGTVGHERGASHVDVHRNTGLNQSQRHRAGEDAAYQRGVQNADAAGAASAPVYVVPDSPPVLPAPAPN